MIEYMYRDEVNIEVVEIDKNLDEYEQVNLFLKDNKSLHFLRIGFDKYPAGRDVLENKNCWEYFYEQVQIPHNVRTSYFYVERDEQAELDLLNELNPKKNPYIFVHDDPDRGYNVNEEHLPKDLHIIRNDTTKNIFHFLKVLEDAQEIHCMESSFKSLIDFYSKTPHLYYHDFRGHPLGNKTNREWNIVNYA